MQRILMAAGLVLLVLAACGRSPASAPADTSADVAGGLPAVTVYKSPT